MMKPEYLQAAIQPTIHVMEAVTRAKLTTERVQMVNDFRAIQGVCAGVTLNGDAEGAMFLVADHTVARVVASKMCGRELTGADESEIFEVFMELVNMIAGNSIGLFTRAGLRLTITPPSIYTTPPEPPYGASCAMVLINSPLGMLKICLSLAEKGL